MLSPQILSRPDLLIPSLVTTATQVTIVLVATLLATFVLRRQSSVLRHAILLTGLACSCLVPLVSLGLRAADAETVDLRDVASNFGIGDFHLLKQWSFNSTTNSSAATGSVSSQERGLSAPRQDGGGGRPSTVSPAESLNGSSASQISLFREAALLLLAIWLIGAIVRTIALLRGFAATRRILRESCPYVEGPLKDTYHETLKLVGGQVQPRLLQSSVISSPLAIGVFRPAILLPSDIETELDRAKLQGVLLHEIAHVLRGDNLIGLAQRMIAILWWPHPLVHYLNRLLSRAREEICDNYAVTFSEKHSYANALLQLATRRPLTRPLASTIGLFHSKWRLEDRIRGLLDHRRSLALRFSRVRALFVLGAMGTGMLLLAGARVVPPSEAETIALIRSHGGTVTSLSGAEGSTERVMIMQDWTGTTETLRQLKYIPGIKEIWFSGTKIDEIVVEDLPDLERLIFNVNFYDNSIGKQVHWNRLPVSTIRLKGLPKIKAFDRRGGGNNLADTQVTKLELVDMDQLTEVHVEGPQLQDGVLQGLSGAPKLSRIQARRPMSTRPGGRTEITDAGLKSLPELHELTSLDLDGSKVTNEGLRTIAKLASLQGLGLNATDISDEGLPHLAVLPELTGLGVGETRVTDQGLKQIVIQHPKLKMISIGGSAVTAAGLDVLKGLSELTFIDLDSSQLTEQSCSVLASLPVAMIQVNGASQVAGYLTGLPKIRMLSIAGTENLTIAEGSLAGVKSLYIRGAGPNATRNVFQRFSGLGELETLEVSTGWDVHGAFDQTRSIHLNDELMRHVSALKKLKFLWLSATQVDVGDSGFEAFESLTSLEGILLPRTKVTDRGTAHLAGLINLTRLTMSGDGITNESLRHFRNLKKLRQLNLNDTSVDQAAAMTLKASLPNADIQAFRSR